MITQAQSQLYTIRDLLRFAVSQFNKSDIFFGHGSATAYDEAAYLILSALHLPLDQLEPFLDARLIDNEREQVLNLIKRRVIEKIPAAYLTNEAWLGDYRFYVDQRVIVPRSFIAELLQTQLAPWIIDPDNIYSALDLCTGSGCLAILLAHSFNNAIIDASDISADALEVARKNVTDYDLAEKIHLIQSDLLNQLPKRRYDLIISNPPYVNAESMARLPEEYRHEPRHALASGEDGLDAIRTILQQATDYLTEEGLLIVEIGHNRSALEQIFPRVPFTWLETNAGDEFVFLLKRDQIP
ncbi:[LSU ribosomal protein L3P]-glutamine N5-methyltransferase [Nitrosomonas cryotolerans]|uniref:Ribosomal protein uL3 glutamine methyltransferase n=1 Tax=Nitrosomonas cryotolerans ATCC 49181 TaxID=1131553 RepID=A0A1N6IYB6_9PROT|nr:50S ribosomal protein L3 N(5)-glutamine methyltransferase [Nitrosomonas cryotolerans]SFQ01642.1 [LSU ribosomal protein L3P]-glutamine N5-methyltransferase [Nitrosomonas cryotolerans]SIO36949.1 [LSU ribosomal protein L3P]-glutamine N5-methyltransferase [Nitrosomonas cryotolerans ATCC 49181]